MKHKLPQLTPLDSPWMKNLINNFKLQSDLMDKYGSPLNVHHLPAFRKNIAEYRTILNNYNFKSKVFYARKANKCRSLASTAIESGIGVDTASYEELKQCLDLGINSSDLVLTAAIKNAKLLRLAICHEVLIVVDNKDEADLILKIAKEENTRALVGFRLSGFEHQGEKLKSRFGFDIDEISDFTLNFFDTDDVSDFINFNGFHFHLDGYDTHQRGTALHQTLDLIDSLKTKGFELNFIDIGGGILMNYLAQKKEWQSFQTELKKAVLEERKPITYNNNGLGFIERQGKIEGKLATYPYYNERSKKLSLEAILNVENKHSESAWQRLEAMTIELRLEPGRSLLDQVGLTMAKVAHRKKDAEGTILIGLEMNMTQMTSSSADFLLDPFVTYAGSENNKTAVEVYFTGAYCLERDIILKRKIALPKLPEVGDCVSFVNTAGYMMHFFETQAHLFELSQNVFLDSSEANPSLPDFKRD
jgi:diaminopimelate decarboxylase